MTAANQGRTSRGLLKGAMRLGQPHWIYHPTDRLSYLQRISDDFIRSGDRVRTLQNSSRPHSAIGDHLTQHLADQEVVAALRDAEYAGDALRGSCSDEIKAALDLAGA